MIIACEKCHTKYAVPDNSVGIAGRNVKCAKCGFSWLQKPLNYDNIETQVVNEIKEDVKVEKAPAQEIASQELAAIKEKIEISPESKSQDLKAAKPAKDNLPAVANYQIQSWMYSVPVIILVLLPLIAFAAFCEKITNYFPVFRPAYAAVGVYIKDGLEFQDTKITKLLQNEVVGYEITASIINKTPDAVHLPDIKLTILDKDLKKIATHIIQHEGAMIEASSQIPLTNTITSLPAEAKEVVLEFTNSLDF